ncbi:hypothetical protein [Gimesia aquarii]|uniref:Uncharacterized protein n=1 Tax=Gimesia aquarii TaxID=2527964 RepID=A0A517WZS7_9PLAN|nr:hypothetical protein [Gimesia aquarii]QDU10751.1 hypothetical protein V202x_41630 [Gimesia aquarii]
MPNANPACNPPNDISCDPAKLQELVYNFPYLCLDTSQFDPGDPENTLIGAGTSWTGLTTNYSYVLNCEDDNSWVLSWGSISLPPIYGSEKATGGSFPGLTFPSFSTRNGSC